MADEEPIAGAGEGLGTPTIDNGGTCPPNKVFAPAEERRYGLSEDNHFGGRARPSAEELAAAEEGIGKICR